MASREASAPTPSKASTQPRSTSASATSSRGRFACVALSAAGPPGLLGPPAAARLARCSRIALAW